MSRSERKRRYRARRRMNRTPWGKSPILEFVRLDRIVDGQITAAIETMRRRALEGLGIPAKMLEGRPAVGLDFGHPNAAVVVADRTPGGQWIVKAD